MMRLVPAVTALNVEYFIFFWKYRDSFFAVFSASRHYSAETFTGDFYCIFPYSSSNKSAFIDKNHSVTLILTYTEKPVWRTIPVLGIDSMEQSFYSSRNSLFYEPSWTWCHIHWFLTLVDNNMYSVQCMAVNIHRGIRYYWVSYVPFFFGRSLLAIHLFFYLFGQKDIAIILTWYAGANGWSEATSIGTGFGRLGLFTVIIYTWYQFLLVWSGPESIYMIPFYRWVDSYCTRMYRTSI